MAVLQGIQIPFSFSEFGGVSISPPLLKIKNNIQSILTTLITTRFMEPGYGSLVPKLCGEMNDPTTKSSIIKEISERLSALEQNIKVLVVDTKTQDSFVFVYIKYIITSFDITDDLLVQV